MECDHPPERRVNDRATGDQICTECGRVLEAFAFDTPVDSCDAAYETSRAIACPALALNRDMKDINALNALDDRVAHKVRRVFDLVKMMAHAMKFSDRVIEMAGTLLTAACARGYVVRDGAMHNAAASALYYACKLEDVDRAEVEIAANCGVTMKHLTISNKRFRRALALTTLGARVCAPANPLRLIPRFVDALCADPTPIVMRSHKHRLRTRSEDIGGHAIRSGALEGKSPECCCIAFIFRAMLDLGYDAAVLSTVCARCGLTPHTITNALAILDTSKSRQTQTV